MTDVHLQPVLSRRAGFRFGDASSFTSAVPPLGPLAAFTGTFRGSGFNATFRPDGAKSPAGRPKPVTGSGHVFGFNLTLETLSFSPALGPVPSRGSGQRPDIFLNGVPYLQTITDVTVPSRPIGIHFEPGIWLAVPSATDPAEGATIVRMASVPGGATIEAQGKSSTAAGKPVIPAVSITPCTAGQPDDQRNQVSFPSQAAAGHGTARIPRDVTSFLAAGPITQAMLDDPNTVLRDHIASRDVISTTTLSISAQAAAPLPGGGTGTSAFLTGSAATGGPGAQAIRMDATFWIETVRFSIQVPVFEPGQPALVVPAETGAEGQPVPGFLVNPPIAIKTPRTIKVSATQIQYSQRVFLNFNGLAWPHVSVATLVPDAPVTVPASVWA
jgi:hypothetical protein